MGEVAAHTFALDEGVIGGASHVGMGIAERDMLMHEINDGLDQGPALRNLAEGRPGEVGQAVCLAVAAAEKIDERVDGKCFERSLCRLWRYCVGFATVQDAKVAGEYDASCRRADHVADVAVAVSVLSDRHMRLDAYEIESDEVPAPARVDAQSEDHGRGLRAVIGDPVTCPNFNHS
jgi:hypothetical protein